ncbi:hypothetical protein DSL72_003019 [Monilinia vaccinii-corymbosi]|uniref:Cytochrome P450 n=1 Tax=Monilinia vaccinii-corymbosi TaxID=61207 RepID=A0A8A3P142_9HELO|nr:hypothetical protein DSL72_003019 [Monilinia vaccinii-corymbosi]
MFVIDLLGELEPIAKAKYALIALPLLILVSNSEISGTITIIDIWKIFIIIQITYNIYFHPLSSFPGPKSYAATDIPFVRALISGNLSFETHKLHKKYGEVVRIAPNDLSYDSAQGFRDIYGYHVGRPQLEKARFHYDALPGGTPNIASAASVDHSRFRRVLSHAFSDKAMREQNPIIKVNIDLLIQRLKETSAEPTDMVKWYNWTTFDIFGDLCFGEPFQCLEKANHNPWVSALFESIKLSALDIVINRHPILKSISTIFTPKHLLEQVDAHSRLSGEKVAKRIATQTDRPDFMTHILKNQEKSELTLTDAEIKSNANILIIAGSETTATAMSGMVFRLLQNPEVLQKLVKIIRETFASEDEITIDGVGNLPYLQAVIDESIRMYPPTPIALPRTVGPNGETVCGRWIPANTTVSVNLWAAFQSETNFTDPGTFIPERFMGDERFASDNFQAFEPFSLGPRNCIGRQLAYTEMRLITTRILWNFDLELCDGMTHWHQQKIYSFWEKGPLMVRLHPRQDA